MNECLNQNEKQEQEQESKQDGTIDDGNHEFVEMISLIPASTTSYFDTSNDNKHDNQNDMELDHNNGA